MSFFSYFPDVYSKTSLLILEALEAAQNESAFDPSEINESQRFKNLSRRQEWLQGRFVVKELFYRRFKKPHQSVILDYEKEKPVLRDPSGFEFEPHVSLAHKKNIAVAAVSEFPVGVDVEVLPVTEESLRAIHRVCSPSEWKNVNEQTVVSRENYLIMLWCLKEACVKSGRIATVFESRDFDFELQARSEEGEWKIFFPKHLPSGIEFAMAKSVKLS